MSDGDLTIRERLERLETAVTKMAESIADLNVYAATARARITTAGAIAAILISLVGGIITLDSRSVAETARQELCASIDADHNRERDRLLQSHYLLYRVPAFSTLIKDKDAELIAYENARRNYYGVRDSRPAFCSGANPVRPFPTLEEFRG